MNYAHILTRASVGIEAPLVTVEVHVSSGLPAFNLVGLPATVVKESKERVRSAIVNSGFRFPLHRVTVNLAPADLPKEGGNFDMPIAIGILSATGQIAQACLDGIEFIGELSLSGELRPVSGILPAALACQKSTRRLCLPSENLQEAQILPDIMLLPCARLLDACQLSLNTSIVPKTARTVLTDYRWCVDMSDIKGQFLAKRALEVAAAGGHHMLMLGPPGTGKTMLAGRLPTILPPLAPDAAVEITAIESVAGIPFDRDNVQKVRLRTPHHSISSAALLGGGVRVRPGEISLAHHGVLFLDELAEFRKDTLEQLREPLESGIVHIARANTKISYPARFQLIAAMNPKAPNVPINQTGSFYGTKISMPLLDRIDIQITVTRLSHEELLYKGKSAETSALIAKRVCKARALQQQRNFLNANASAAQIETICQLGDPEKALLRDAVNKFSLSGRAYHKTLKVARTIADLDGCGRVAVSHIAEAIGYRLS